MMPKELVKELVFIALPESRELVDMMSGNSVLVHIEEAACSRLSRR